MLLTIILICVLGLIEITANGFFIFRLLKYDDLRIAQNCQ